MLKGTEVTQGDVKEIDGSSVYLEVTKLLFSPTSQQFLIRRRTRFSCMDSIPNHFETISALMYDNIVIVGICIKEEAPALP
jgi:hypothetical protein